ncbi:unnamed protein product [Ciceribacter sp. T2.26MG-112.2]|uniref:hypothetical protein n=1 Tax=Ciceribacter sp. T2.26MG-112.2 TaxID=3137154 RepID=UPI000E14C637|nr:unnamed protein product [Ciceribacter naphthalenivorans]
MGARDNLARPLICARHCGQPLLTKAQALFDGSVDAKSERLDETQALCAIRHVLKGLELIDQMSERSVNAIRDMLKTASDVVVDAPDQIAAVIHATLAGAVRIVSSKGSDSPDVNELRHHMRHLVTGYLGPLLPQVARYPKLFP